MKLSLLFTGIFCALMLFSAGTHLQHGIVGLTQMNGEGCLCHNFNRDETVRLTLTGPDSLYGGSSGIYTLKVTGGPKVTGGFNVAARRGIVAPIDTNAQLIDNEITHTRPKAFVNDTLTFRFKYTAPVSIGNDTIFSVSLSTNGDLIPTDLDKWNFGAPFRVKVLPVVPVELVAFSALAIEGGVELKWKTATELNNAGFEILSRANENESWKQNGFVKGKGTVQNEQSYSFTVKTSSAAEYRLVQRDLNGTTRSIAQSVLTTPLAPANFSVEQNYPNPFNNRTKIGYTITSPGIVSVEVFSVTGSKVMEQNAGIQSAGYHSLSLLFDGISAGTYFYRLRVISGKTEVSAVKKLVYLK